MNPWCSMTRRQVFASFAAAVTTISLDTVGPVRHAGAADKASSPVILGTGNHRYQVVENWGELPPGYTCGDTAAVCVDSKDNVYVFTRGAHPVIVYDRNGKFLRSWGEDIGYQMPTAPRWAPTTCSISPTILDTRCASARRTVG